MQDGVHGPFKVVTGAKTRNPGVAWQVNEIKNDNVKYHKFETEAEAQKFAESKE